MPCIQLEGPISLHPFQHDMHLYERASKCGSRSMRCSGLYHERDFKYALLWPNILETTKLSWPAALNVTATTCGKPVRDNTHVITIVAATTGSCAILLVLLRLYTAVTADTFGLDDGASAVAGVLLFAINGLTLTLGPAGIGRDIWTLSFHDIYRSLKV